MSGEHHFDAGLVCRCDPGDHDVLVRREPELASVHRGDGTQGTHQAQRPVVADAAVADEQREMPGAVVALHPAELVGIALEAVRA